MKSNWAQTTLKLSRAMLKTEMNINWVTRCFTILLVLCTVWVAAYPQASDDNAALKARGDALYQEAEKLLEQETPEAAKRALPIFIQAADLFAKAGAIYEQAESVLLAGRSASDSGDENTALKLYSDAVPLYRSVNGYEGEAVAENNIGQIFFLRGDMLPARERLETAEKIATRHKLSAVEALITGNLGALYDAIGDKLLAVPLFHRSVDAARREGDRGAEAHGLNNLGKIQNDLGARKSAIDFYTLALDIARELKMADLVITTISNLGTVWHALGDNKKALEFYDQAEKLILKGSDKTRLALVLNNIGRSNEVMGNFDLALTSYARGLPLAEASKDKSLQSAIRSNIGTAYLALREYGKARIEYDKAIGIARSMGDKNREATILLNIGNIHQAKNEYEQAIASYLNALKLTEQTLDVQLGITVLNNIGMIYVVAGQTTEARQVFDRAIAVAKENGDREIEARLLNNIGQSYYRDGDNLKAVTFYNRSVAVSRAIVDKSGESGGLTNLMYAWEGVGNRNVAIFFGKQAVNGYQSLRGNIKSLDSDIQKTYLASVEDTYRKLAGLLISAGRIAEAEEILTMLKKEELIDFVRRDDKVANNLLGSIALTVDERATIARYETLADKITSIGSEFGELEIERKNFPAGEFPKQIRYDELRSQLADASAAFEKFLDELKLQYGQRDARVVQADASLRSTLDRLKAHRTAAVATIIGEKGVHLIVTTSKTQRAHFIAISEEKVGELVTEMRSVLRSPINDPRPASQAVYDILVKPIEADLAGIKADTILWSLDGALRYVPPAALWSKGKGYLAERFSNVVINLASRETLALPAAKGEDWNVLGVGVSKATDGFDPLFAVPEELACIVTDGAATSTDKCKEGVLPGRRLMDDVFTLDRFESEIGRYQVIHIASHFQLTPGDDKNSFLLVGGGADRKLTVDRLRSQNLSDVELIVLSACNTATPGGARTNGIEIEGFGSVAHEAGAKSVIATLWSVFDASTKDVMVEFYRGFRGGKITKAEALRRAQIAVMNGEYKPKEGSTVRSDDLVVFEDESNARIPFKADPKAPFAHPYYWSPFILMGNWR